MKNRILIIAGGTGGHIFPALAVARALREKEFEVQWLGSRVGMELDIVGNEFPLSLISIQGLRGKSILSQLMFPWRLCLAVWQAWRIIRKLKPKVVLGMGGFVSGPGGIAARILRIPLIIHEQNAIAGLTNRVLSKQATVVLQGFPNAFSSNVSARTVGNPVRPEIAKMEAPQERLKHREGPLRILIMGGSRGARAINQAIVRVLRDYPNPKELTVWHQTGSLDFEEMQQAYKTIVVPAVVEAFIHNVSEAYAWADFIICRAGALTVSEIAAAGLPSILIPFPYAVDDHQYVNGSYLSSQGAAELIRESELSDDRLRMILQRYVQDRAMLLCMAEKARSLAKLEALSSIVTVCQELIQKHE